MNTLTMSMAQGLQMSRSGYTQRQWDRTVGWGKVPKEYSNMTKYVEISLMEDGELSIDGQTKPGGNLDIREYETGEWGGGCYATYDNLVEKIKEALEE